MINYYLVMYKVTNNGNLIEDATYFIKSPEVLDRPQVKEVIKKKENYTTENIVISNLIKIEEEMFKGLAENKNDCCFKIV
ncbi:hypothetical protein [Pinibacter aurantiacus]|uniref:Uncharacterized protein n=1 Tax=Pinibacter aurantiacus TaxID=2851599 RepID=A0A9E2W5A5_9BACT|nr:hypothetical protein [Pinibacter aurantiacus]MBV4358699.1 hypothetical protein [Pinibacter aurantiacus]